MRVKFTLGLFTCLDAYIVYIFADYLIDGSHLYSVFDDFGIVECWILSDIDCVHIFSIIFSYLYSYLFILKIYENFVLA